jgi:hypothetical protein
MLSASNLKNYIQEENSNVVNTIENPSSADFKLAMEKAMKKWLEWNGAESAGMELQFAWSGTNVSTGATEVSSITAKLVYPSFVLPPYSDPASFGVALTSAITTGIITFDDPTYVMTPTTFISSPIAIVPSGAETYDDAMTALANIIITNLLLSLSLNVLPIPGQHLAFTGTATLVAIS